MFPKKRARIRPTLYWVKEKRAMVSAITRSVSINLVVCHSEPKAKNLASVIHPNIGTSRSFALLRMTGKRLC